MGDDKSKGTLSAIPLLKTKAGPRDKDLWPQRLKEEYLALIADLDEPRPLATLEECHLTVATTLEHLILVSAPATPEKSFLQCYLSALFRQRIYWPSEEYVEHNKKSDNDWFRLESNKEGTRWFGKCWFVHDLLKYEFDIEFDIPVTFPTTSPEIALPELDGKTAKMYRGGKICLSDHFKPLWGRNVPKFGIAHAMALGLGPWLAVEVPDLIEKGIIQYKDKASS